MNPSIPSGARRRIGVGVIGASPSSPGWAVAAHIPAIRALPEFELVAVSTSRPESARAAAQEFGVIAYHDSAELIADPRVELIVVAVKVPHHHELVSAVIAAGKMVFSEWPLGVDLAQAVDLAEQARARGVRTFIGLQGRQAPAVRHARDLVRSGYLGDVLATTLVGSGIAWGGVTDGAHAYMFNVANGATTLTVPTLHALDAVSFVLGEIATVSAVLASRRSKVRVADTGQDVPVTAPDHVAVAATLQTGVVASVFYRGGVSRGDNLRWEINGTEGDLVLTSAIGNLQVANLALHGGRGEQAGVAPIELPAAYATEPGGLSGDIGANVLRSYTAIARDLADGTQRVPNFEDAVKRHRLVSMIELADASRREQRQADPERT